MIMSLTLILLFTYNNTKLTYQAMCSKLKNSGIGMQKAVSLLILNQNVLSKKVKLKEV
ncbi:MAG: hypothetical protein GX259_08500 [Bacteroidales bacterium]|nr:hypothetical protein [Bacteroidales bacterium]